MFVQFTLLLLMVVKGTNVVFEVAPAQNIYRYYYF